MGKGIWLLLTDLDGGHAIAIASCWGDCSNDAQIDVWAADMMNEWLELGYTGIETINSSLSVFLKL